MLLDVEVEIVDPIATEVFLNSWGFDGDGNLGLHTSSGPPTAALRAVQRVVAESMTQRSDETGLKMMGGSAMLFLRDGARYKGIDYPGPPARNDDGSFDEE